MQREIKFRGQMTTGEWVFGLPHLDLKGSTAYFNECSYRICWNPENGGQSNAPIKNGSLCQFTGLLDKNGTEIYEGDIVSWKETRFHTQKQIENNIPMPKIYKSIVYYEDGGFIVSSDQEKDTPLCCFFNDSIDNKFDYKAEVIGNIYENPELFQRLS